MIKPKRYRNTRVINIERDPYKPANVRDPGMQQARLEMARDVLATIGTGLIIAALAIYLSC